MHANKEPRRFQLQARKKPHSSSRKISRSAATVYGEDLRLFHGPEATIHFACGPAAVAACSYMANRFDPAPPSAAPPTGRCWFVSGAVGCRTSCEHKPTNRSGSL